MTDSTPRQNLEAKVDAGEVKVTDSLRYRLLYRDIKHFRVEFDTDGKQTIYYGVTLLWPCMIRPSNVLKSSIQNKRSPRRIQVYEVRIQSDPTFTYTIGF